VKISTAAGSITDTEKNLDNAYRTVTQN